MATTKRYDDDNALKGGWGIDGDKDAGFDRKGMDREAIRNQFGSQALDPGARNPVDTDYDGPGLSGSRLLENAREGNKPLLGKGNPQSAHQTGVRDGVKPYIRPTVRRDSGW